MKDSKQPVFDYLDGKPSAHDDQLVSLLREVEQMPETEADDVYWQNFNQRLDARIDAREIKRKPVWRVWAAPLAAAAVLALLFFIPTSEPNKVVDDPSTTFEALAQLGESELNLLGQVYDDENESAATSDLSLETEELEALLHAFQPSSDFEILAESALTAEEWRQFRSVWDSEG